MTKPTITDIRFDFRGGRNTAISPDLLNTNELVDSTNVRLSAQYGGITKRSGCQRIHQTAFPAAVQGVFQWDDPISSQKQIVVICADGHLYYRNGFTYSDAFMDGGAGFPVSSPYFAPFRAATANAPLVLFIAVLGKLFKWTGAALADITGVNGAPQATTVIAYHTRLFATDVRYPKTIFWSRVGDGEQWGTGSKVDGGSALINVLNGEEINGLEVIGSSLLLGSPDSIARFTGHASDDIVIAQDTEGVSSEVGPVGRVAIRRFENVAAILTERGPYVATEIEVVPIGEQIGPDFANIQSNLLPFSPIGYNKARKELLFPVPAIGDSHLQTIFVQSVRLQCWYGPWQYSFGSNYLTRYEDVNGDDSILSAGSDGFVRDMDVGAKDDILYDGSGGVNITMTAEIPVIHFGQPGVTKALQGMMIQGNFPVGSNSKVRTAFDEGAFVEDGIQATTGEDSQRIDLSGQGKRLYMQFTDDSDQIVGINGYVLEAWNYGRR